MSQSDQFDLAVLILCSLLLIVYVWIVPTTDD